MTLNLPRSSNWITPFPLHPTVRLEQAMHVLAQQAAKNSTVGVSALKMPRHIDVSFMEVMPTDQAAGGTKTMRPDGTEVPPAFEAEAD